MRECSTLCRKLAGDFLPKVGEGSLDTRLGVGHVDATAKKKERKVREGKID